MIDISHFRLHERIYESESSIIFRSQRLADAQPVVVKLLKHDYVPPELAAWLRREYEIIRNFQHTGIIKAYELLSEQHRWAIILEDFGGDSLHQLQLAGKLPVPDFLDLAIKVADALGHVHQQRVMHKDINPSNIVLNLRTGEVKLIDFGIAAMLSRESPTFHNPKLLEGTLAYLSPEQTGRMNRAIDYRTDFYSLGVTFYELLSGQLPFQSSDPLELVHGHIAKQPLPPHELRPAIPQALSTIVIKLMAKNAEDRYQSAHGLKADLAECARQMQAAAQIVPFALGQLDVADRFHIPQKLYGREHEISTLVQAFERVSQGASELMLVSGYPGIGKSALVREVYKPLTHQRGFFVAGKFDQLQRNIPYSALLQAVRSLVRQLLAEGEAQIAEWREKLLAALGRNGKVLVDVISEIALIVGPQPDVPELPPTETQQRFNLVFRNFIQVFTRPEHPLVIFLDDMQWADSASLNLIPLLITADNHALFLIGAYRDNEVSVGHPLLLTLDEIRNGIATVNTISLVPLSLRHATEWAADTFHSSAEQAQPLAELLLAKTGGNPFFIGEFLKSLYAARLVAFDYQLAQWRWDLEQIRAQAMTDNVVDMLASKVLRLPAQAQAVLKLAACIGSQFDLETLAIVNDQPAPATAASLQPSLFEELVVPLGDTYKLIEYVAQDPAQVPDAEYRFAHDRIQQAVYSLIADDDKHVVHLRVGQLLLRKTSPRELERRIFDIANHLNQGRALLREQSERDQLASLNRSAGEKARSSAAYAAALGYFRIGIELLIQPGDETDAWERQYDLMLALHENAAEAAYLIADYAQMDQYFEMVRQRARTTLDQVKVYEVKSEAGFAQHRPLEAIRVARQVLNLLQVKLPEQPRATDVLFALAGAALAMRGRRIEDLADLPRLNDPYKQAAMRSLMKVAPSSYLVLPTLVPIAIIKMLRLSLQYGNAPASAYAYAGYGLLLCGVRGDIDAGYGFGQLALKILEQLDATAMKSITQMYVNMFIFHWKHHVRDTLKPLLQAYQMGLDSGDLANACNCALVYCWHSYHVGDDLAEVDQEMAKYGRVMVELKQITPLTHLALHHQAVLNLQGSAADPCRLSGQKVDIDTLIPVLLETNNLGLLFNVYLEEMRLCYLFHANAQAWEYASKAAPFLDAMVGTLAPGLFHFYDSLIRLSMLADTPRSERQAMLKAVAAHQKKLRAWAKHAPMNYQHKYALVEAERARVLGKDREAREHYSRAVTLARDNQFVNEEALACELAGRFYLERNDPLLAKIYLWEAHHAYQRWGAIAKVKDLEARYAQMFVLAPQSGPKMAIASPLGTPKPREAAALDLTSVVKASQAISGEIMLDKLLAAMMSIIIENAGAQSGYLLLERRGQWRIEAEGAIDRNGATVLQSGPIERNAPAPLPATIINFVVHTRESVVLNDATHDGPFAQDPYIVAHQPKSVLCAPLLNQGRLAGILYLENNLTRGAFTEERLEVLRLLSAQAAISLNNARLYADLAELNTAYERFVPREFLQLLNQASVVQIKLGDHTQMDMTVLFSDIRGYTPLSESMTPRQTFDFLNSYLSYISPVIRAHNGFINQYYGDGIMALFAGKPEDAIEAAIDLRQAVARFNGQRLEQGQHAIQIGIALHTSTLMLGTIGEEPRMTVTVIGDTVNTAARLEGLTKQYGVTILTTQETLQGLADPGNYHLRFLGKVQVKGKQQLLSIFEIFDGDDEVTLTAKKQTRLTFEAGLRHYQQGKFIAAFEHFDAVLAHLPSDSAAQLYQERAAHYTTQGVPAVWEGVDVLTQK